MPKDKKRIDTKLVTGGRRGEWLGGMVNVPVTRTSTVLFDSVADLHAAYPPEHGRLAYGRHGTPAQWSLAEALSELEPGAAGTALFPSGLAAVAMALLSVLSPGDELLMVDSAYTPTRTFCDRELGRLGITTVVYLMADSPQREQQLARLGKHRTGKSCMYYDPLASADDVAGLLSGTTRAIFLESPGSLTFEVQDVPGICALARARGIRTLIDNTWATPLFFRALEHGVDLAILACTKYIAGHSDVMIGSVTAGETHWRRLQQTSSAFGQFVSPDDAYLTARGLRTLAVRLKRHEENGLAVARWLGEQPQVARVLRPAFETCPGHEYWKRDFSGSSGLFSFVLNGGDEAARDALVDRLELFGIGYSWGGFESLAVPADPIRTASPRQWEGPMVRLHIGLEDPRDLVTDLAAALAEYPSG